MRAPNNLNALRAFEAAARHHSFVAAADELCVTPTAVGQLIRALEDKLDVVLFHRSRSGSARLALTDIARSVIPDLQSGFDHLAAVVERLRTTCAVEVVLVRAPRAFADKWLLPRLQRFRALCPDCDFCIDTNESEPDRPAASACIGVRYGQGQWHGWESRYLLDDTVFPVCHPTRVAGARSPICAEDLRSVPLIHDASSSLESGSPTWRAWLNHAGVQGIDSDRGLRIDDSSAVIAAAIAGNGVALGRSALVAGELAAGRLIRPFGPPLRHDSSYYVVHRPEHADNATVIAFRNWLMDEARTQTMSGAPHKSFSLPQAQIISVAPRDDAARVGAAAGPP